MAVKGAERPWSLKQRFCDSFSGKNSVPVVFHIHNNPAFGDRLVEGLVDRTDVAVAVAVMLAVCISMMNDQPILMDINSYVIIHWLWPLVSVHGSPHSCVCI